MFNYLKKVIVTISCKLMSFIVTAKSTKNNNILGLSQCDCFDPQTDLPWVVVHLPDCNYSVMGIVTVNHDKNYQRVIVVNLENVNKYDIYNQLTTIVNDHNKRLEIISRLVPMPDNLK
jgi:hypothetical protein